MMDQIELLHESPDVPPALPAGLSILVPVYNSSGSLAKLVERLWPVAKSLNMPFELILVNDGSSDNSWNVICELVTGNRWIRGICLMRNYGQHNALLAGLRAARYGTTATLDDDLQHPPEELPKLLAKLGDDLDVVYGSPEKETHGFLRNLASVITKIALRSAMGAQSARHVSAFRAFKTTLRQAFDRYQSPFVSLDVLLTWGTTKFGAVRIRHDERHSGTSTYTFAKLLHHALDMMTGFSTAPLQLASLIGFACTLFGIAVFFYVVGRYCLEGSVPGFPFLASIIAIFSGAQLFALGVIGEYLARMHFRTMNRPVYFVRSVSGETTDCT
jgi:glycosyltransferase involved in cell wall biosynthesis